MMQESGEKPKRKKIRRDQMYNPGVGLGVKVVDNNVDVALKLFKKMVKDSGVLDELRERCEHTPNSVKRIKKLELAKRKQYLRSKFI